MGAFYFQGIGRFMNERPAWPRSNRLHLRLGAGNQHRKSARATMRAPEMKTQSPSGSRGRAGVRISNLPPWLSLLCMVVYIKEEPAMQTSVLALLGSQTGEARASVGNAPSNRHIQGMARRRSLCGPGRRSGPSVNRNAGQDAATRSQLQDTAPLRLPQNLLPTFLLSE